MAQKKKSVPSNRHGTNLKMITKKAKKPNVNRQVTKRAKLSSQKFKLSGCRRKKESVPPDQGSNNMVQPMDISVDQQAVGVHFQEEIFMDILSRLPVRSLLRFKCVSKFWETLISDPYFKMKHLSHAKNDGHSQKLLISPLHHDICTDEPINLCCASLWSDEDIETLDFPSRSCRHLGQVHCCCDGLVLLTALSRSRKELLLWNPSTRESVLLPLPKSQKLFGFCYGMGYDAASNDYKILMMHMDNKFSPLPVLEILGLKSGSWREVSQHPTDVKIKYDQASLMAPLAFVHGAFHWLGFRKEYCVVSFSISNEVYREIPVLDGIVERGLRSRGVTVLGGSLCIYITHNLCGESTFKLWVTRDYGVKGSWTVWFKLEEPNLFSVTPKYGFPDGDVLLCCCHWDNNLHYVFKTSRRSCWSCNQRTWMTGGIVFTESMISPKLLI